MRYLLWVLLVNYVSWGLLCAQDASDGVEVPPTEEASPVADDAEEADLRSELNLLGQTDSGAGESRRNENVQFNAIDNNALKELNVRLGATATIIGEFEADKSYFGSEFGAAPESTIHLATPGGGGQKFHSQFHYGHLNSATSARSFFQVGAVKPAREHEYGFNLVTPLWDGASLRVNGGQTKIRGMVNGNVLVPLPEERTPLTNDPETAAEVTRIMSGYPNELPPTARTSPRGC